MDLHVEFGLASKHQARELYQRFYSPDSEITEEAAGTTKEDEKGELPEKEFQLVDLDESRSNAFEEPGVMSHPSHTQQLHAGKVQKCVPQQHSKLPILSTTQIDNLAEGFSYNLPEREFSMAGLQGYLMMYKTGPVEAVRDFGKWIEQERKDKRDRKNRVEKEKVEAEVD